VRIVDSNVLYGFWPRRRLDASLEAVSAAAAAAGITELVLCSIRGVFHDVARANDETVAVCRANHRYAPAAAINPLCWFDSHREIDRMESAGVRVFRFFPEYQGWDYRLRPFTALLRRVREAGGVAITSARLGGHLEAGAVSQLLRALEDSGAACILTGVYYGNLGEVLDAATAYPNLFVETHLLNGPDSLDVVAAEVGAGRLIYGSGAPLHYVASSLLPLRHCALEASAKQDVAWRNLSRVAGWPRADR
jgi:predicted TIM-barrel fold metal-dependent hydrolase